MSLSINSNLSAGIALNNLADASQNLQKSLNRLSSGSKIGEPSDDAGGLAVSMKMGAAIKRQAASATNLANTISYLQTQDGVLKAASEILDRMGELKLLAGDQTKNASDKANYQTEFADLQTQLNALANETFNGKALFGSEASTVFTTENASADSAVTLEGVDLLGSPLFEDNFEGSSLSGDWVVDSGSVTVTSNELTLGSWDQVSISQPFTEDISVSFDFKIGPGNDFRVEGESTPYFYLFGGTDAPIDTWHSITFDMGTDGSLSNLKLNGSDFVPGSGVNSDSAGDIVFSLHGGGGFAETNFRNLAITSASGSDSGNVASIAGAADLDGISIDDIKSATEDIATFRSTNGAQQSRLQFASEQLSVNQTNLEAANSRIVDVDVADESTQLARYNVLMQAGASMLQQANQTPQLALRLLA